ncbi:MAG: EAL domain-containing protein [Gaiellaceae bacterium]
MSWAAQQLVELLAAVTSFEDEQAATRSAVERTAEALDAQIAARVRDGEVCASIGFPAGREPVAELVAATAGELTAIVVPGVGTVTVAVAALENDAACALLVGRAGEGFGPEELALLRGMARVLALTVRLLRSFNALQQRQRLLERSTEIQRAITRRAPLQEVLESIAEAARELVGDEVAGLRMIDVDDPTMMVTAATSDVSAAIRTRIERGPIGEGAGGRAIAEGKLVVVENYSKTADALPAFSELELQAAMAAPVHERGTIVGSLTVASYRPGRSYSEAEQQMLVAFAEHASLAVMDATTVDAIQHQALHDSLSGLPNRRLFLDRLQHALQRRGDRGSVAVIFLDLDRFKSVNDSLGHDAGDRLLVELARRLNECTRGSDTIARLGGDEFAVLMEGVVAEREAARLAERMCTVVREPVLLGGREILVTASAGIALARGVGGDPLRDADTAMYRAKEAGGGTYEFFEPSMRRAVTQQLGLEADLQRGIRRGELVLYYQPFYDLNTLAVVAVEALARWRHPERGLLAPAIFIPIAEETGAIVEIGRWALREACLQLADWQMRFPREHPLSMSVNFSSRQLQQPRLARKIEQALVQAGLDPAHLILELTETTIMQDTDSALETLRELKSLGARLALDDFGTGYSSLCSLRSYPLDILKIPRPFIEGIEHGFENSAVARASLQLADTFGLDSVAEGIETRAQLDELVRIGCRYGQGYFLGRPQPPIQLESRLSTPARPRAATLRRVS